MPSGNHGYTGPGAYNADGTKVGEPAATTAPSSTQAALAPAATPAPQTAPSMAPAPGGAPSSTAGIGAESCVRIVYAELAMVRGVEVWPTDDQMRALVAPGLMNPNPQQLAVFQACLIHWPQVHGELVAYQAASPAEKHLKARAAVQVLAALGLLRPVATCPGMDAIDCTVAVMQPAAAPAPVVAEGEPVSWRDDRPGVRKRKRPAVKTGTPAPAPAPVAKTDAVLPGLQDLLRQSNQTMQKVGEK